MYVAEYTASTHTVVINKVVKPTIYERIIHDIADAIDDKFYALEIIEAGLEKERTALVLLDELLTSGELGDLNKADVIKAKNRIGQAISSQLQSIREMQKSIERLEDSLTQLGCQVE